MRNFIGILVALGVGAIFSVPVNANGGSLVPSSPLVTFSSRSFGTGGASYATGTQVVTPFPSPEQSASALRRRSIDSSAYAGTLPGTAPELDALSLGSKRAPNISALNSFNIQVVPEPTTWAILGAGFVFLLARGLRCYSL